MTGKDNRFCRIQLPAELRSLPLFIETVTKCAARSGLGEHKIGAMELALEEAIVNIVKHSSIAPDSLITVECGLKNKDDFTIDIIDGGPEFDPLAKDTPDTAADIDSRPIGGLGIFLIKEMTDGVSYTRKENRNILTITMKRS
ncbi:MAG: ATP-binding protein [Syntrophorhabdaceae bacterium]|nr:ATP-binding protein [Syntrophorhabdaceae bacterium]MDD4196798.1 ATP-binding protein [Syntrophorhabdaceae bacterium]